VSGRRVDQKNSKLGQVQICHGNPGVRGRSGRMTELISYARQLLEGDHPQTLRQLHYAIFSRQVIPYENTQSDYKRLSRATTMARREYRDWELGRFTSVQAMEAIFRSSDGIVPEPPNGIPPHWMVDETRNPEIVSVWDDPVDYIEAVKDSYRRDNWQDQPRYCEVWSEKATIMGAIRRVADELGITLRVCHGYGSTGMESQIGSLFTTIRKPVTVFYLGDHDPSGHGIEQDMHTRVQRASGISFEMRRLAIHAADIRAFNLPPQKIKSTDSRAASFRRQFGDGAATVELDALPANELRRRISEAVIGLLDRDRWARALAVQEVEFTSIAEFGEHMRTILAGR
jgi:hypothetical protein